MHDDHVIRYDLSKTIACCRRILDKQLIEDLNIGRLARSTLKLISVIARCLPWDTDSA